MYGRNPYVWFHMTIRYPYMGTIHRFSHGLNMSYRMSDRMRV